MNALIIKPTAKFSRENPCTKVEIWNCFYGATGFTRRAIVETRGEIGLNVPKYLLREGYAEVRTVKDIEYYDLTKLGRTWLTEGLKSHLQRHPMDCAKVVRNPWPELAPAPKAPAKRISRRAA